MAIELCRSHQFGCGTPCRNQPGQIFRSHGRQVTGNDERGISADRQRAYTAGQRTGETAGPVRIPDNLHTICCDAPTYGLFGRTRHDINPGRTEASEQRGGVAHQRNVAKQGKWLRRTKTQGGASREDQASKLRRLPVYIHA